MRNQMSPGNTPSQHTSTLAISPYISNRSSRKVAQIPHRAGSSSRQSLLYPNNDDATNNNIFHGAGYRSVSRNGTNFQTANSPLGQKVISTTSGATIFTPYQSKGTFNNAHNNSNSLLSHSVSKNGMLGYTVPSSIRKVSFQREYKDASNSNFATTTNNKNDVDDMVTTLTTNTASTTTAANDINLSDLSSIEKLRLWRHDALMQHMYITAEYVGDKVYNITNDPNDAFWLAQVYFNNGHYPRAISLLSNDNLIANSIICRYMMALSLVELHKYDEALDIVGETNPFATDYIPDDEIQQQSDGGIKLESSLCYLRGKIFCALNNFGRAKDAFKEAVIVDVKNFEAFDTLISTCLLSPQEEWNFLHSLDFSSLDDNKELIKNFYTIRLSKLVNRDAVKESQNILTSEYNLSTDVDVICSFVDTLFTSCKFEECLDLCEQYLNKDAFNPKILPTYIACLFELRAKNKLFLLSHDLAERFPKNAITWFSVATYYVTMNKIPEARKFFSKASILDPTFAPAWLGFAHTYALEGEQDQALSAYSTAARFFPGSHLPYLFLGMQYMCSNTISLAEEYFTMSYDLCPNDPLLLNEMGVMYYKREDYEKSKKYLKRAVEEVKELDPTSRTAISIQTNLGHTYKKLGENERAIKCFKFILEDSEKDPDIFCTLGFLYLRTNQLQKAIDYLHQAIALKPSNSSAQELLVHALELNVSLSLDNDHPLSLNNKFSKLKGNTNGIILDGNGKDNIIPDTISKLQRKRANNLSFQPTEFSKKFKFEGNSKLEEAVSIVSHNNNANDSTCNNSNNNDANVTANNESSLNDEEMMDLE